MTWSTRPAACAARPRPSSRSVARRKCSSHGVLSGPAIDRINDSVIDELLLLDTIPYPKDKPACDKIHYLPVAPVFAEAINRIYEEMSISSLFE